MTQDLSPSGQLAHTTVRIECDLRGGGIGTGTGFCFDFCREDDRHIPVIVTNKHVVKDAVRGRFLFTEANPDGAPIIGQTLEVEVNEFEACWINHPSNSIDLCVFPIAAALIRFRGNNRAPFYRSLDSSLIPTASEWEDLVTMEDIVMIGYPNGIWDPINNMPVFRRGITGTHPSRDYNGQPKFLIDAACFPGSSGSPVVLFNIGGYTTRSRGTVLGASRIKLLGILFAGPQYTAEGDIEIIEVPTQQAAVSRTDIPINLGICIRSTELMAFEPLLRWRGGAGA